MAQDRLEECLQTLAGGKNPRATEGGGRGVTQCVRRREAKVKEVNNVSSVHALDCLPRR